MARAAAGGAVRRVARGRGDVAVPEGGRRDRQPGRRRSDLRPPLRARDPAGAALEPALARRRHPRPAPPRLRHPAVLLPARHAAGDGRHDGAAGQPPAANQRGGHRPLPELRRPAGDGLPRGLAARLPPRHLARRPTQPDRPRPHDVQAAARPAPAAAAHLGHLRPRRPCDTRASSNATTPGTATRYVWRS